MVIFKGNVVSYSPMEFVLRHARFLAGTSSTFNIIHEYLTRKYEKGHTRASEYLAGVGSSLETEILTTDIGIKTDIIQQLVFLSNCGQVCDWADFHILEALSHKYFFARRIGYTAAAQIWRPNSDVVMMATNLIKSDLNSSKPKLISVTLSAIPHVLSAQLAENIWSDVISLMKFKDPYVRMKATVVFYQICSVYTDALVPGFHVLKELLGDSNPSVVFSALTVFYELCCLNPKNFVPFIPKLFKLFELSRHEGIAWRLMQILRVLADVEPRLAKKLAQPLSVIFEVASNIRNIYECMKIIIELNIEDLNLISLAANRLGSFLSHRSVNLRYLGLSLFVKLMKTHPKLVLEHKELISKCVDSDDDMIQFTALDLLSNLVSAKSLDGVIGKMLESYSRNRSVTFRDTVINRVIDICSKNDYELIVDFDWYITILGEFISKGGFSDFEIIARQFLDLAARVPKMRAKVVEKIGRVFDDSRYRHADVLLLAASHIISEHSQGTSQFAKILQPHICNCSDRVQMSCIQTAFSLYLRARSHNDLGDIESLFLLKLPFFENSKFPEVRERASSISALVNLFKEISNSEHIKDMWKQIHQQIPVSSEIEKPQELSEPLEFMEVTESELIFLNSKKKHKRKHKHKHEHKQPTLTNRRAPKPRDKEVKTVDITQQVATALSNHHSSLHGDQRRKRTRPLVSASRRQNLGSNGALSMHIIDSHPKPSRELELVLQVRNLSDAYIPSLNFHITPSKNVSVLSMPPKKSAIKAKTSARFSISISVTDTHEPHLLKILVVPTGGDVEALSGRAKILPSSFLVPADPGIDSNEPTAVRVFDVGKAPGTAILQAIANGTQGKTQATEPGAFYARTVEGNPVICKANVSEGKVTVEMKCESELANALLKEIGVSLKKLC